MYRWSCVCQQGSSFPPGYRPLSEVEVYSKVTHLFKDQPQLLAEFSQFLPDAGSGTGLMSGVNIINFVYYVHISAYKNMVVNINLACSCL